MFLVQYSFMQEPRCTPPPSEKKTSVKKLRAQTYKFLNVLARVSGAKKESDRIPNLRGDENPQK